MPEESITAMSSFIASWFTSTSLFLLLNLMIGTIVLISRFNTPQTPKLGQDDNNNNPPPFFRAPSLLERVKSFNFSLHRSESSERFALQIPYETLDRTPGLDSGKDNTPGPDSGQDHTPGPVSDQDHTPGPDSGQDNDNHVKRTKSVPNWDSGEVSGQVSGEDPPVKMKKSASEKLEVKHSVEEEIVERQRPATVRESRTSEHDGEVDAKADDFINKFKQQLKLQRLDSLLRYKDMLSRGAS